VRVLVVFTYGYSLKTWDESGTLERELSIYSELQKKYGIKFTFLTYGDRTDLQIVIKDLDVDIIPIYKYQKKSSFKLVNILKSFYFPFKNKKLFVGLDIIKQNQLQGSWVALIIKRLLHKPLFTRTGYDVYKFCLEGKKNFFIRFLYLYLTKITIRLSNIYSVSNLTDLRYSKFKYNKNKQFVLRPNWILPNEYNEKKRFSNKILCVGRLEDQKNFGYIINEFKGSNFEIDIVGKGSKKTQLYDLSVKNNVKVNFLKNIDNKDLIKLYSDYRYFISSSLYEGHPKTVLEAMHSGCIVFLSDISNHSELVDHGVDGYTYDLKKGSLKELFKESISDEDMLKNISQNAHLKMKRKFSLEQAVITENEDYKNILNL
tara:strand:- start:183 stop:1301 length:1119 start_codon:yes stop_codon:yes gene_type:complete